MTRSYKTPEQDMDFLNLPEWAQWKGEGPVPASWEAVNPQGVTCKVYRSYADYCDD